MSRICHRKLTQWNIHAKVWRFCKIKTFLQIFRLFWTLGESKFEAWDIPSLFWTPCRASRPGANVSQCQLIYSVITTTISLILALARARPFFSIPAEILLLMCFCHIKYHHDAALFCHLFWLQTCTTESHGSIACILIVVLH